MNDIYSVKSKLPVTIDFKNVSLLFTEAATGGVLRNCIKFIAKHLCQSLFFNKVADLRP